MYQLYYSPNACSLATQVVLHELDQQVSIIDKRGVTDFSQISPTGAVPALKDNEAVLLEGAAIMLHILKKQETPLFPDHPAKRTQATEDILFANATMHPAYSKLFFVSALEIDDAAKQIALQAAANSVNALWEVVEQRLQKQMFLSGAHYSAADIMLTIYSRWNQYFSVDIVHGERTRELLALITNLPSFQRAIAAEAEHSATYES